MPPEYVANIMCDYIRKPLLQSLQNSYFTFFCDETSDITSIEKFALYAIFKHDKVVKEHFIWIIVLSKIDGTIHSVPDVFEAIQEFFQNISVPF